MTLRALFLRGLLPGAGVLLAAVVASLLLGAGDVGPERALSALLGGADGDARFTVLELRLPRTLVAVAVGLALGIAGALLQAAARNPLAEPGLLGVSAGASFAVVVALTPRHTPFASRAGARARTSAHGRAPGIQDQH
ncbi:iron chelate uptake ABC transporter family permease subunit, partial [Streptomyces hirsutus]|uniref:iron chelate uptake ABC transporter family permease subunit n=1 Tax=Streptomyces hirsutus TaxID=35620 RepID=UPI0033C17D8D